MTNITRCNFLTLTELYSLQLDSSKEGSHGLYLYKTPLCIKERHISVSLANTYDLIKISEVNACHISMRLWNQVASKNKQNKNEAQIFLTFS